MGIRYEKLYKALELCAGPECCTECPYHGETRGGMTCRARLLGDAAVALAIEETRANEAEIERDDLREEVAALAEALEEAEIECDDDRPVRSKKTAPGMDEMVECALKTTMQAEYWRGQAEALKELLRCYCCDQAVEDFHLDLPGMHGEPEPGAEGDV